MESPVFSQYLINRKELLEMIEAAGDTEVIAIRVVFSPGNTRYEFKMVVLATNPNESQRSIFCEYHFNRRRLFEMARRAENAEFIVIKTVSTSMRATEEEDTIQARPSITALSRTRSSETNSEAPMVMVLAVPQGLEDGEEVAGCPNPPSCSF